MESSSTTGIHDHNPGLRFYLGAAIIILSFFMVPTGLLVTHHMHNHALKALILGFFWVNGPLWKIIGIGIMGKVSYYYIIEHLKIHYKKIIILKPVSKRRYYIGLFMFTLPFVPSYVMAYAPHLLPELASWRVYVNIFFDLIFLCSLFVLGGDFWDKLRALFNYTAKANFPDEPSTD
ncbi:MAG: hypothetical protein NTY96_07645 [Bacteroidetes bacterium]|nr:hypothetical protein [Bacteroidota bacterium]